MLAFLFALSLTGQVAPAPEPAPEAAPPHPSDERIVCRTRPRLGSRIIAQRSCRRIWEWRVYERDMEQSRRDIGDRGAAGCDANHPGSCINGSGGPRFR